MKEVVMLTFDSEAFFLPTFLMIRGHKESGAELTSLRHKHLHGLHHNRRIES